MPTVYLSNDARGVQIAEAVRRLAPAHQVFEREDRFVVEGNAELRIPRRRFEEALGEALDDTEWMSLFARHVGEVIGYDNREFSIDEYLPGDGM
jgi:hypothetical protein